MPLQTSEEKKKKKHWGLGVGTGAKVKGHEDGERARKEEDSICVCRLGVEQTGVTTLALLSTSWLSLIKLYP